MQRAILPSILVFLAATMPVGARADSNEVARSQALFEEGLAAFDAGRVQEACERFERSLDLDFANGTLMNLARCHEHQGLLAKAWSEYRDAAELSRSADQPLRAAVAEASATRLSARLPRLRIVVPAAPAGVALFSNGEPLRPGMAGEPVAVEPGVHHLSVWAPGHARYETTVTVPEGAGVREIVVPPLRPVAWDKTPLFWSALGTGAVGLTALATGGVLGVLALDAPTAEAADLRQDASIGLLSAGVALAGAAAVMTVVAWTDRRLQVTASASSERAAAVARFDW